MPGGASPRGARPPSAPGTGDGTDCAKQAAAGFWRLLPSGADFRVYNLPRANERLGCAGPLAVGGATQPHVTAPLHLAVGSPRPHPPAVGGWRLVAGGRRSAFVTGVPLPQTDPSASRAVRWRSGCRSLRRLRMPRSGPLFRCRAPGVLGVQGFCWGGGWCPRLCGHCHRAGEGKCPSGGEVPVGRCVADFSVSRYLGAGGVSMR